MEIVFDRDRIIFNKTLNSLDRFAVDFTSALDKVGIKYVLVSGYVAILFGRNRSSEDIDIIVEKINLERFETLWNVLIKEFECIITDDVKDAFGNYLSANHAIRFSRKNEFIPNIELKFPKVELDYWTLEHRKKIIVNGKILYISPIELQISFKLFLGSKKDIEDASYLYGLFKGNLDVELLNDFNQKLNIEGLFKRYLK
jgi:hypothetical protein